MISLHKGNSRFPVEMFRRFPRGRAGWVLLAVMQALAGMMCRAGDAAPEVHPPSKWVMPRSFIRPKADDTVDPSQDYRWLLSDRQINALNDEEFMHEARQTLTSAGVQFGSHILINYDPTCQTLTFHWARLWRGTNKLDRLDPSQIHVGQAGLDTEEFLFSSKKTAILLLEDVRIGDIVDYAYTIEGGSPALGSQFFNAVQLQFKQPVERAVTRLVWPSSRRLFIKNHLTDLEPVKIRKTNTIEFTWAVSNVPAMRVESPTPVWFDPYPWVQLSECQKWSEVNRWALRLFTTNTAPSPELARKINEWKRLPEPSQRVLAALRFVQEEVRYLGMEDGAAGYEPVQPSVVFARRYGDCKDKSFLLLTMLRALKIDAFPVLVNTRRRQALAELQPSPVLFNHALVQVNLGGQSFWLDSTGNYERGLLTLRTWPNYGLGLTVAPGVAGLTAIPPCPVQPRTTVTEYIFVGHVAAESTLKIVTVAEGRDADSLRERFATTTRDDIEQENLNAYAKLYPFIRRTEPLVYSDDEQQNRVETTESYAIEKMWTRLPDEQNYHARIYSVNVDAALVKPAVSFRTMPLGLRFPVHQIFHAELNATSGVPIDPANVRIDNPAFFFHRTVSMAGGKLFLNYEYQSWTDAVAPEAVPAYVRDLATATEALGYAVIGF
jgi:transglutaminase-like putative cysteine protease